MLKNDGTAYNNSVAVANTIAVLFPPSAESNPIFHVWKYLLNDRKPTWSQLESYRDSLMGIYDLTLDDFQSSISSSISSDVEMQYLWISQECI